jgi:hypothetical protein
MTPDVLRHLEAAALHLESFLDNFRGHLGADETTLLLASDEICQALALAKKAKAK